MISTVLIPIIKDKSGDVTDKSNYRPIALSSIMSKVLEHLLLNHIESFLYTSDNQFGFKAKHSTDQCIYVLKEVIDFYRSHNSPMFISFMDASKAFDRVNHWSLFKKLLQRGIPHILVRLIIFWYRSQSVCVKWGSVISPSFSVLNGVRQGGILSPMLFNLYVDDLSSLLSSSKVGCIFGDQVINHISYADDLVVFCPSSKGLQKLMYICESYGATHDIAYNQKKTVCMVILPARYKLLNCPKISLNGAHLSFVTCYKYLGIICLNSFMDDNDITRQMRCFYIRGNFLARSFAHCSDAVKVKLFKAFCTNMYCCHLWFNFNKCTFNKLRVAYNNCFRKLLRLPRSCRASAMFVHNSVVSFGDILRKMVYGFICRIESSHNVLLKNIILVTCYNSKLRQRWSSILYSNANC